MFICKHYLSIFITHFYTHFSTFDSTFSQVDVCQYLGEQIKSKINYSSFFSSPRMLFSFRDILSSSWVSGTLSRKTDLQYRLLICPIVEHAHNILVDYSTWPRSMKYSEEGLYPAGFSFKKTARNLWYLLLLAIRH